MHLMSKEDEDEDDEGRAVFEGCNVVLDQILEVELKKRQLVN